MRQRTGATRLGDDGGGQLRADAGDLIQPGHRAEYRRVVAGAGDRPGGAVSVDAPAIADHRELLADQHGEPGDPGVAERDLVQQQPGDLAVVVVEHPIQRGHQGVVPGLHPAPGQGGQRLRVTLAGDHRGDHVLS